MSGPCHGVTDEGRQPQSQRPNHHELLRQLAEEEQHSMQSVLDRVLERYCRGKFLRAANADFEALRCGSKLWQEELEERSSGKQTLADRLAKESHHRGARCGISILTPPEDTNRQAPGPPHSIRRYFQ
jgi:hypothetical protein